MGVFCPYLVAVFGYHLHLLLSSELRSFDVKNKTLTKPFIELLLFKIFFVFMREQSNTLAVLGCNIATNFGFLKGHLAYIQELT